MKKGMSFLICVAMFATGIFSPQKTVYATPTVSNGEDPNQTLLLQTRFRNQGDFGGQDLDGWEMATGLSTGFPAGAVNRDFGYGPHWSTSNYFEIVYNSVLDTLKVSMDVNGGGFDHFLTYSGFNPASLNYIMFQVWSRDTTGEWWLTGLTLNSTLLGTGVFGTTNPGSDGIQTWNITGEDLSSGFTLSGTLNLTGPFANVSSEELNKIDFKFGTVPEPEIPEPATMALIGTGLAALAARRKRLV
ncbi:MAG: PEP-CTERM sorting domain-containing protein [Candidatus Omnitrophica bacterium]|nr:PEP-CTERM sorting domain-containing protein [Candidatus Omnitrophota bacterium]